ncbi:hypothetical protein KO481_31080 [Nocardia sp. NEAU-G5]|uniref:Uncharacterized protein n=1 Tax=Nocardia albiluteola TaxID=2842303 RepID=A0ABS6B6K3_9NOCA|nr:hypothetical protein [Nocardia albiluteola]MBU3065952.1 hypothetical protein [Nocardia albiluteola]
MPSELRARFDEEILNGRKIWAIHAVREHLSDPVPGIHECLDLLQERCDALGER